MTAGESESESKRPKPVRPAPARGLEPQRREGEAAGRPASPAVRVTVDGVEWMAETAGTTLAAPSDGAFVMVLVSFREQGEAEPSMGAWLVGRALDQLDEPALEEALRRAHPWREGSAPKPFFPVAGGRRGR